jgi:hypothetical protein
LSGKSDLASDKHQLLQVKVDEIMLTNVLHKYRFLHMKNQRFSKPSRMVVQKVPVSRLIPVLSTESIMEDLDFDATPIVYFGVFGQL